MTKPYDPKNWQNGPDFEDVRDFIRRADDSGNDDGGNTVRITLEIPAGLLRTAALLNMVSRHGYDPEAHSLLTGKLDETSKSVRDAARRWMGLSLYAELHNRLHLLSHEGYVTALVEQFHNKAANPASKPDPKAGPDDHAVPIPSDLDDGIPY